MLVGEGRAMVPLLMSVASAPVASTPLPAPAPSCEVFPNTVKIRRVTTTASDAGKCNRTRGFHVTKCYT